MRKAAIFALLACFLLSLTACGKADPVVQTQAIEAGGQSLIVQFDENTLSAGIIQAENGEYAFEYDGHGGLTIVYPDGYVYTQTAVNGGIGFPADYDAAERESKGYVDGFSLHWGLETAMDNARGALRSGGSPNLLLALLLLALGAWNLFAPRSSWQLSHGWRYKNAEPSDLALTLYRLGGILLIFAGVLCGLSAL